MPKSKVVTENMFSISVLNKNISNRKTEEIVPQLKSISVNSEMKNIIIAHEKKSPTFLTPILHVKSHSRKLSWYVISFYIEERPDMYK